MAPDFKIASQKLAAMTEPRLIAKISLDQTRPRFREQFKITSYPSFIFYE
jgi:hypothetical protein